MTKNLLRFSRIKLAAHFRHWELPFKNQWDMDKNHWLFRDWLTIAMFYHHRSPPWVLFIQKSLSVRYWSLMKLSLLVDNYQGSFDKSENPLFPVPRQNRNDITIVILTHVIDRVNFSKAFPCFLKFTSLLQLIPYFCVSCYFRMQYIQFTAGLPNGEEGQNPPIFPSTAAILRPAVNCGVFFKNCDYSVDHILPKHFCPPDTAV